MSPTNTPNERDPQKDLDKLTDVHVNLVNVTKAAFDEFRNPADQATLELIHACVVRKCGGVPQPPLKGIDIKAIMNSPAMQVAIASNDRGPMLVKSWFQQLLMQAEMKRQSSGLTPQELQVAAQRLIQQIKDGTLRKKMEAVLALVLSEEKK